MGGGNLGLMVEMTIYGVSFDLVGKQPIVLLKTAEGNRYLPIWIGHPEAAAILLVGLLFGLSHGLLVSLPIIVLFGCVLAWIRSRTDSVFPGMVLHGSFNLIALVVAVVH